MTADTVGGVWTYALELARTFAPHGIEVLLASMGGYPSEAQLSQISRLPNVRLFESAFRLEWMEDPWEDVGRAGDWLLELEARYAPDLVHLNNFTHGDLAWRAPVLMAGHSCVLSWWEAVHGVAAPAAWSRYEERVRQGLQAAGIVVAPSRSMLAALEAHYGPFQQSRVIANARHRSFHAPAKKEPFILAAGRLWDQAKNIAALTGIASRLPWPVLLAGEGRCDPNSSAKNLGPQAETELASLMARASIYALPALYEPFGLSILEAALCKCALVLGDIPSLRENWTQAALFVDPRDPEGLLRALNNLIDNPSILRMLGARARERALEFEPEVMGREYLECYRGVIATNQVSACA